MTASSPVVYGSKSNSRCLLSIPSNKSQCHDFLIGTQNSKDENEIQIIRFDEKNYINKKESYNCQELTSFYHQYEIWHIAILIESNNSETKIFNESSNEIEQQNCNKIITTYRDASESNWKSTLWKFPDRINDLDQASKLQNLTSMKSNFRIKGTYTRKPSPLNQNSQYPINDVALINTKDVKLYDLNIGQSSEKIISKTENCENGVFDIHSASNFYCTSENSIHLLDCRLNYSDQTNTISPAHEDIILSIDINPIRPYQILTSSADRSIKFWDIRKINQNSNSNNNRKNSSLITLRKSNSHFMNRALYNPFHDELILSASTESVELWKISTCSSYDITSKSIRDENKGDAQLAINTSNKDYLICDWIDCHSDSIYGLSWSISDAWTFASLSYDGRVVINHVPTAEKYKILL